MKMKKNAIESHINKLTEKFYNDVMEELKDEDCKGVGCGDDVCERKCGSFNAEWKKEQYNTWLKNKFYNTNDETYYEDDVDAPTVKAYYNSNNDYVVFVFFQHKISPIHYGSVYVNGDDSMNM
jgi:hypothetical protein